MDKLHGWMYICLKLGTCRWLIVIIEPKADFRRAAFSPQSLILVFLATSSLVYSFLMFRGKQFWKLIHFSSSKGGQLLNMCRQNSHTSIILSWFQLSVIFHRQTEQNFIIVQVNSINNKNKIVHIDEKKQSKSIRRLWTPALRYDIGIPCLL